MATKGADWNDLVESTPASSGAPNSQEVNKLATNFQNTVAVSQESKDDGPDLPPSPRGGINENDKTGVVEVQGATIYKALESFDQLGLKPELLKGVYDMGFSAPSKIQAQSLPIILSKERPNLWGQAQHGSGKTASYALSMLSVVDENQAFPQALCVCPVRELALQVVDVITKLGKYTKTKAIAAVPNVSERDTKITAQIVVGTAGTIQGQIKGKQWDPKRIRMLVLDEADVMIDQQNGQAMDSIKIKQMCPKDVQVLLFSATFPDRVISFAQKFAENATKITVKTEALSLDGIQQYTLDCGNEAGKYQMLTNIYGLLQIGSSIIFVHTVATAKQLANKMRQDGFKVSLLHGKDMQTSERDAVMKDFRENRTSVLITTNVLARGVDVLHVNVVINYEMPLDRFNKVDPETYIHRIGRSGRFGRKGVAINFVYDDISKKHVRYIEEYFSKKMTPLPTDVEKMAEIVKAALGQK